MVFGHRRAEVVADTALVLEKLRRRHCADRVAAPVLGACVATPVPVEAGNGVAAAGLKLCTQHIAIAHRTSMPGEPISDDSPTHPLSRQVPEPDAHTGLRSRLVSQFLCRSSRAAAAAAGPAALADPRARADARGRCSFAWVQLSRREPDRDGVLGWLYVVACCEAWHLLESEARTPPLRGAPGRRGGKGANFGDSTP